MPLLHIKSAIVISKIPTQKTAGLPRTTFLEIRHAASPLSTCPTEIWAGFPRRFPAAAHPHVDHVQKDKDLQTTIDVWRRLSNPTASSILMVESSLSEGVLAILRR